MKLKHACALAVGVYVLLAIKCGGGINDPVNATLPSPVEVAETIENVAVQTVEVMKEVADHIQEDQPIRTNGNQNAYYNTIYSSERHLYRIRSVWDNPSTQIGAYYDLELAKQNCPEGYSVFDENGNIAN